MSVQTILTYVKLFRKSDTSLWYGYAPSAWRRFQRDGATRYSSNLEVDYDVGLPGLASGVLEAFGNNQTPKDGEDLRKVLTRFGFAEYDSELHDHDYIGYIFPDLFRPPNVTVVRRAERQGWVVQFETETAPRKAVEQWLSEQKEVTYPVEESPSW